MNEIILLIVQIIAALGVIVSVVYLGIQIRQQNEITKAEFGHSLSNRMYERYFNTSKDDEFSKFLSKDWSDTEKLSDSERWRVAVFVNMILVDIFDTYDKVKKGFVDESHLEMRIHMLKLGTMKTDIAKMTWNYWKSTRDNQFIEWFESEIYGDIANNAVFDENIISNVRRN
ncbi:MAG: hypothetical protein ACJ0HZ_05915 [Woeseiaceae bacterium]|tara:strand:- start:4003 stop:4518 length:516 start_codon:yes stop_codon:yes gene_type:complete